MLASVSRAAGEVFGKVEGVGADAVEAVAFEGGAEARLDEELIIEGGKEGGFWPRLEAVCLRRSESEGAGAEVGFVEGATFGEEFVRVLRGCFRRREVEERRRSARGGKRGWRWRFWETLRGSGINEIDYSIDFEGNDTIDFVCCN